MRVGYCSPFNPMKSGISDFSEELVFALKKYIEVVIFSPVVPVNEKILNTFEVHQLSELDSDELRGTLDLIVYHIGNNINYHGAIVEMLEKYPGVIELHELGLHHLAAARTLEQYGQKSYLEMVRYCHGKRGENIAQSFFQGKTGAPWNDHALDMCMARPYIEQASGVIVHAEMLKQMVLGIRNNVPIVNIILHSTDIVGNPDSFRMVCRRKLNIPSDHLVIGSFGFATSAKRILPTLNALADLKHTVPDFTYFLVGEVESNIKIKEELEARSLEKNVIITGFASLEDFKLYMGACDFCINLRYPTQGESSASLHRMLGMGKPAIVTDIGTFSDYPDNVVLKVRYDHHEVKDIYDAIMLLSTQKNELKKRSEAALEFAKEHCNLEKNALLYCDFFQQVYDHIWEPKWEDVMIGRLCEMGLSNSNYLQHIYKKIIHML